MGLHSLRISGASAALNSGVHHHVIQNQGRWKWKSDCAKNDIAVGEGGGGGAAVHRLPLASSRIDL